jgi:hypothetical protein
MVLATCFLVFLHQEFDSGVEKKNFISILELLVLDSVIVPSLCSFLVELGIVIHLLSPFF